MIDIHEGKGRNFRIDKVFGLVVTGMAMPMAFHRFVYSDGIGFQKFAQGNLGKQM